MLTEIPLERAVEDLLTSTPESPANGLRNAAGKISAKVVEIEHQLDSLRQQLRVYERQLFALEKQIGLSMQQGANLARCQREVTSASTMLTQYIGLHSI